jgi:hypothetical protein
VTVHNGPAPVAIPYFCNCDDSQTLYDDDKILQSLGWIEQGGGVGYAKFGLVSVIVFVQETVDVDSPWVDTCSPRHVDVHRKALLGMSLS